MRVIGGRFAVDRSFTRDPFELLIGTMISQNTSSRNVRRAVANLRTKIGLTPHALSRASVEDIMGCIEVAGLHRVKAPRIKKASKIVLEKYRGSLHRVLRMPLDRARAELMLIPGVGPKTADVVLAFSVGAPFLPIDTHVARISRRLGIASATDGYEEIRCKLEAIVRPEERLAVHLAMIRFGREVCKARSPLCGSCPVSEICPSSLV